MKTTAKDKEREDFEIERKVWSKCFLCKEEYSTSKEGGNIGMNKECLHSYCMECIEQSATTSLLCPICHSSLPTPLSSLPTNFTLCYWQNLSPPLPCFSLPFQSLDDKIEEIQKLCENCEEKKAEFHCSVCNSSLCLSCSDSIHSIKIMKNHSIYPITSLLKKSLLSVKSQIIEFYQCELHNQKKMKLYCITCNESVCVDCIGGFHMKHSIMNILKRVEDIKEEWKKGVEEISNNIINNHFNIQSEKLSKEIDQVNEEMRRLEDTLKKLIKKKQRMMSDLIMMKESKEKVNQSTSFLLFFLQSLPPLPLSSFLPLLVLIII